MALETGGEGSGGQSAADMLLLEFVVALGHLGPPCQPRTGCHWRSSRVWTPQGRQGRSLLVGVSWGLHWVCPGMTHSPGLWPASGDGVGYLGSISGAFWCPEMIGDVCQCSRFWVAV